jgi:AraC family transcriptional regulator
VADGNRLEYEKRVNRVIDHVRAHLPEELTLATLARVAAFSPFHFHRIFAAITGETLFGFIHRQRIEKAAGALLSHPEESILAVALDHGFSSPATFARAFRAHFGMSATRWRTGGAERWRDRRLPGRNPGKQLRNRGKARERARSDTPRKVTEEAPMNVRVRELPAYHVAYMRYVGPFGPHGIPELWTKLRTWMEARGLPLEATVRLGVAYDDPRITAAEQCRYDACVVIPPDFPPDRWVNVMDIPAGRYAVWEFTGSAREIGDAWDRVFSAWLPTSGYQPDDRPCIEVYRGRPDVDAKAGSFRSDLCLSVRPL